MIHVQLNDKQRQELRLLARQETGHVSERIHFVLLSDQGHSPSEIARIFNYCEATVRFWLNRYLEYGVAGLYDDPRSGRPHKVTQQVEETVVKMIQDDPLKEGNLATFWTVPMLVLALVNKGLSRNNFPFLRQSVTRPM
jgi:transposase